jgi:hypothetical protein
MVELLVLVQQRLKFEEAELLDALWHIGVEAFFDNLN